jgi:hypothetical protein
MSQSRQARLRLCLFVPIRSCLHGWSLMRCLKQQTRALRSDCKQKAFPDQRRNQRRRFHETRFNATKGLVKVRDALEMLRRYSQGNIESGRFAIRRRSTAVCPNGKQQRSIPRAIRSSITRLYGDSTGVRLRKQRKKARRAGVEPASHQELAIYSVCTNVTLFGGGVKSPILSKTTQTRSTFGIGINYGILCL